jgi:Proton-conducting membrane transporter/NADH-Ubiquinone oxidoreductase (complex I), chain 5 N-terminus/LAGLIDADG endonuclease
MYLALLTLPCSTFLCLALFGRFLGARGAIVLSVCSAVSITILAFSIFYEVALCACPCQITLATYFFSGLMDASWGFLFDTLTSVMITVVTLISCLVVVYSCSYMIEDPHFVRFISYLKLFTVAMLVLVTADNYIQLFVGWEGVGLASFLLISFWFTRLQASKAAIQAMLLNRVGDVGLALGIVGLFFTYKTTNYQALFCVNHAVGTGPLIELLGLNILDISCILLFIGAMGKSGQFGLHAWLPNAMNAPTPVSALLHAATMVELCHLQTQVCNLYSALSWKRPKNQKFTIREKIFLVGMVVSFQDHPGGIPFQGHFGEVPEANQLETALFTKAGSSETVRRITPPLHNQKCIWLETCNDFLYWFIGFCEGEGSFVVGADGDLRFELTQDLQDMHLLQHIQATLGFGSVSARQESAVYSDGRVFNRHVAVFTVTHAQNFLKLIQVFNGHLRVDAKQQQFQNWLLRFNQRYDYNTQYKPGPAFVNFGDA